MNISPENGQASGTENWAADTISSAQRTLDNIVFSMYRETTETYAHRIQQIIDEVSSVEYKPTVEEVISLSSYVTLLSQYEAEGGFCYLRELNDRLSAYSLRKSIREAVAEYEAETEIESAA